ncbi:MAG: radical SAM protein [Candidatus Sericytochromatia bacterium]
MKNFIYNILYSTSKHIFRWIEIFINYKYTKAINPTLTLEQIRAYNKQRTLGPSKIICNAPFNSIYVRQNGEVNVCCARLYDNLGDLKENSIEEIWNGEKINNLRENIKNYNLDGACTSCQYAIQSKNYNSFIGRYYDRFSNIIQNEYPTEITFETSNICNLECIMCNGKFSHLIRKNREKLPILPLELNSTHYDSFKPYLKKIKKITLMGGEPFLINEYLEVIEYIINNNPDCQIIIQTNATILTKRVRRILAYKNIEISISLDSLQKETYETIRKNANYENTISNINYYKDRANRFNHTININFCAMQLNWHEIPDIIKYCENNNFSINIIFIDYPRVHSIRSLTKEKIVSGLDMLNSNQYKIKKSINIERFNIFISHVKNVLNSKNKLKDFKDANTSDLLVKNLNKLKTLSSFDNYKELELFILEIIKKLNNKEQIKFLELLTCEIEFIDRAVGIYSIKNEKELSSTKTTISNLLQEIT